MKPHIKEFLDEFIARFEKLNIEVESLILFGSQARGEAVLSSDIDIAVVMNTPLTNMERGKLRELGEEINDALETNLFFTSREAIAAATEIFDTNKYIKEEGIVLWQR